jgi:hypothetical protein
MALQQLDEGDTIVLDVIGNATEAALDHLELRFLNFEQLVIRR